MEFLLDALLDSLIVLPFLLVAYIIIEVIEFATADRIEHSKLLTGKWSNVFAASFGLIPQCGFSVVATDLFASKKLKIGTLLAVYIATSDEAVPILLTSPDKILSLIPLLLVKFVLALIVGYSVDLIFKKTNQKRLAPIGEYKVPQTEPPKEKTDNCPNETNLESVQKDVCVPLADSTPIAVTEPEQSAEETTHHGCCGHEIESKSKKDLWKRFLLHPLFHTLKIFAFILIINVVFGTIIHFVGEDKFSAFLQKSGWFAPLFAVLIGLIPNCASSVIITKLFAMGDISFGACIAGLIVNAGIAFVILFKENKNQKENFAILGGLFAFSIFIGYIIQLIEYFAL